MKQVGIIGGSGFIGSYITKLFLENNFKVKVSSTDIYKKERYQHLLRFKNAENLKICPLNVEDKNDLNDFVKDCQILVHGGTPFKLEVKDPQKELFDPTINGTQNFLESVKRTPTVNKVVCIASVAAYNTNFPFPPDNEPLKRPFTENDIKYYNEDNNSYAQAKFIANQTVESFIKENNGLQFEIVSVSPVAVMGKALSARDDSTSVGLQFLFKNKIAPNPFIEMIYENDVEFAMVDVVDVATAVFKAATTSGNHGKNYIISSDSWKVSDITLMLNNKIPRGQPRIVYSSELACRDLEIHIKPSQVPLHQFSNLN
jgi:nucleoside-diphosphate-sugar epimerase